eukprot:TRINITY_DN9890_c0_g1_i11.p1 TRINITY_DN9890_c0_g1~~TRINITY_DN9890_c0_g1_i11.p1  ORF type:complete len:301 (+),score=43.01 TRINITY_DN9890_c0_g1_i11:314-1216(+)
MKEKLGGVHRPGNLTERKHSIGNRSTILELDSNAIDKISVKDSAERLINLPSRNMKRVERSKESQECLLSPPSFAPQFFKAESRRSRRISENSESLNGNLGLPNYNNYNNIVQFTEYIKRVFVAPSTTRSIKDIKHTDDKQALDNKNRILPNNVKEDSRDFVLNGCKGREELRSSSPRISDDDNFSAACNKVAAKKPPTRGNYTTRNTEPKILSKQIPSLKKSTNRVPLKEFRIIKRVLKVPEHNAEGNAINDFSDKEETGERLNVQQGESVLLFPLIKCADPAFANVLAVPDVFMYLKN